MRCFTLLVIYMIVPILSPAQVNDPFHWYLNGKLTYLFATSTVPSGFSTSIGVAVTWSEYKFQPALGLNLTYIEGMVGTSSIKEPDRASSALEWGPSFIFTYGGGGQDSYKLIRAFHDSYATPFCHALDWSISLGSNYVFRTKEKKHHQTVGFIASSYKDWSLSYYNDGPPFHWILFGDSYDRWWTGGATLEYGNINSKTQVLLAYDNFTGGSQTAEENGYSLSGLLGINISDYKNPKEIFFNRGRVNLSIGYKGLGIEAQYIGARAMGPQHYLHYLNNYPYHPSIAKNGFRFGFNGTYGLPNQVSLPKIF